MPVALSRTGSSVTISVLPATITIHDCEMREWQVMLLGSISIKLHCCMVQCLRLRSGLDMQRRLVSGYTAEQDTIRLQELHHAVENQPNPHGRDKKADNPGRRIKTLWAELFQNVLCIDQ